ncbi:UTP14 family protein [Aspergillus stella-maris]|uniref:UTP14 family protein n=1 Tax=Aspergillus stella-maris TaxID=1810926 RepID=UPI003CCE0051
MPRKQTQHRGPRDSENRKPKPLAKKKSGKLLNAFSIAEAENPTRHKIRRSRLGEDNDYFKRKRQTAGNDDDEDDDEGGNKRRRFGDDDEEINSNEGSDGEGNKWRVGVDSDNDSELDSDEAMGESDEERFEGFTFRGSSTYKDKPKPKAKKVPKKRDLDLSEGEQSEEDEDEDMEDDDDLGEDAIDLVAAWDMNVAEEEEEAKKAAKAKKRAGREDSEEEESSSDDGSESDDEQEGSDLEMSDDEDGGNDDGLSKLQSFVDSIDTSHASKPIKKTKSGQEYLDPTEFGLTSSRKLTVADLLPSVTDSRLKNSLKHVDSAPSAQKTSTGIPGKLDAPLAKRQQDRLDREAAYEQSKETLGRWIETVKANRRAEHLMFPLPDPDNQLQQSMGIVKPQTGLENTIQDILVESGLADAQGKSAENQVAEIEELQARSLPIEEIRARRAELRKHRDLLFREEVRAKRIKKIKSKSYRRVHRKEQERLEQKERQALIDAGIDPDEEDREKNERLRAEARMGNKHKESKWAKSLKQTGRTAWDENARDDAIELAQREAHREEELRQRIEGKRVSRGDDDYLGSSDESESENENPWEEQDSDSDKRKLLKKLGKLQGDEAADAEAKGPHHKLLSMKFMQNAEAARKAENDAEIRRLNRELQGEESQSEAESEEGRRKFGVTDKKAEKDKSKKQVNRNEFEEAPGSDEEQERNIEPNETKASSKAKTATKATSKPTPSKPEPAPQEESDAEEDNPWLIQTTRNNRRAKTDDGQQTIDITTDTTTAKPSKSTSTSKPAPAPKSKSKPAPTPAQDDGSDSEDNVPVLLKNHDLVKRAFAGDEVVADFEQEKLDAIEDEGDKVIDETLPGWGSWTGDGVSRKEKKRQRKVLTKVEGIKPENRKDAKLNRVIINEKTIKKNNKYLATQLPHPFESKAQYERSLRVPIGPEWSTKETFQSSTKPRVMVKQGVIKPMEKPMA